MSTDATAAVTRPRKVNRSLSVITDPDHLREVVADYLRLNAFAFDTETRGDNPLNAITNEVFWVSLAGEGMAHAIPIGHPRGRMIEPAYKDKEAWWDENDLTKTGKPRKKWRSIEIPAVWGPTPDQMRAGEVFSILEPLFFNEKITKVGHNLKFDLKSVAKYYRGRLPVGPYADTLVIQQLVNENLFSKGLKDLTKFYFKFQYDKLGKAIAGGDVDYYQAARYARLDAKYTWLIYTKLIRSLRNQGLSHLLAMDMDMLEALAHAELAGITVDRDRLEEVGFALDAEMEQAKGMLYKRAGEVWNVNSAKQKGWYVYEVLGHPVRERTKGGQPSTAKGTLEKLAEKHEDVAVLQRYSELQKLHGTYVEGIRTALTEGKVHTTFNLHTVVTGRLSSSDPNLQNIPAPGKENSTLIRGMFTAAPGHKLIVSDYGQIEYRVMADLSEDETYSQMFWDSDTDPHILTAMQLFGLSKEEVGKTERSVAKNTGFAIAYGAGPDKVAAMSGVNLRKAKEVMHRHQMMFPGLYEWINEAINEARRRKPPYFATKMGRKRRLPGLLSPEFGERARCERQGINHMVQGTAAELMKLAFIRLHEMLPEEMDLLLTVHDEVVVQCPEDATELCVKIVDEALMGEGISNFLSVPIVAYAAVVDRWADAK